MAPPIIPGSTFELYLHGGVVECRITKLYSMSYTSTGTESIRMSSTSSGSSTGEGEKSASISLQSHKAVNHSSKIRENKFLQSVGGHSTGEKILTPKCIPGGRCAKVKIVVNHSVCIEPFKICDALGRFALRSKGRTCAVGICEKVKRNDNC